MPITNLIYMNPLFNIKRAAATFLCKLICAQYTPENINEPCMPTYVKRRHRLGYIVPGGVPTWFKSAT